MKHVVLVGGGHAHVHVLKRMQQERWPQAQVTLISPNRYQYYSGMFSGYVEGVYGLEDIRIDLVQLCQQAKVTFIEDTVNKVVASQNEVWMASGTRMAYDVISFNVGSYLADYQIPGVLKYATMIKPNSHFTDVFDVDATPTRWVVVGGGASGFELSLALQARGKRSTAGQSSIMLISSGELLEGKGEIISRKAEEIVRHKKINLRLNEAVVSVQPSDITLASGAKIAYDRLIWLAGPQASPIFRNSGMMVDNSGYLLVNDYLQSIEHANVFGAGDCIAMSMYPTLDKAGVYAVREAPILYENLLRYLSDIPLRKYKPQAHYLSILSAGEGEALLLYRGICMYGKWCFHLKRHIDTTFIRNYQ